MNQPFFQFGITGLTASTIGAIASSEKGQPDGVATLGSDRKVLADQLPLPTINVADIVPILFPAGKLLDELIPDRCLTWSSLNAIGGVPKIGEDGKIPDWVIPQSLIDRLSFLEAEVVRLSAGGS
jgi:hypothetical protein